MKYIGFYDTEYGRRKMNLAAVNKMNYIAEAINEAGEEVEIISVSTSSPVSNLERHERINKKTTVYYLKEDKWSKIKIQKKLNILKNRIKIFMYAVRNIKRGEEVLVYHSLELMRPIYYAKKIKGFNLILEVEEFYNDVVKRSERSMEMEKKFIGCAEKYIFPTELLCKKFNVENKPYTIIYGTYRAEAPRNAPPKEGKIHLVYAGTFDPRKGGGVAARTAEYLPENYHIHIAGFGDKEEIEKICSEVNKKSKATVTFDGVFSGEDYIKFIQSCDIGLSTQDVDAAFNSTSFPSKILSYMANGLRVVTVDIPAIRNSKVGKHLCFFKNNTPKEVAEAVLSIDMSKGYDSRKIIKNLDLEFVKSMSELLKA